MSSRRVAASLYRRVPSPPLHVTSIARPPDVRQFVLVREIVADFAVIGFLHGVAQALRQMLRRRGDGQAAFAIRLDRKSTRLTPVTL